MITAILTRYIIFIIESAILIILPRRIKHEKLAAKDYTWWLLITTSIYAVDYIWTLIAYRMSGTWLMPMEAIRLITENAFLQWALRAGLWLILIMAYLAWAWINIRRQVRKLCENACKGGSKTCSTLK